MCGQEFCPEQCFQVTYWYIKQLFGKYLPTNWEEGKLARVSAVV